MSGGTSERLIKVTVCGRESNVNIDGSSESSGVEVLEAAPRFSRRWVCVRRLTDRNASLSCPQGEDQIDSRTEGTEVRGNSVVDAHTRLFSVP